MGQAPALDDVTADVRSNTDDQRVDFHGLGLAGCIDRLTTPLRQGGTSVRWETPHHGIEIPATTAALLYDYAEEILGNAVKYAQAMEVTVRLAAVFHGVRLTMVPGAKVWSKHSTRCWPRSFTPANPQRRRKAPRSSAAPTMRLPRQ